MFYNLFSLMNTLFSRCCLMSDIYFSYPIFNYIPAPPPVPIITIPPSIWTQCSSGTSTNTNTNTSTNTQNTFQWNPNFSWQQIQMPVFDYCNNINVNIPTIPYKYTPPEVKTENTNEKNKQEEKTQSSSNATENTNTEQINSASKVTASDKIDTRQRTDLNKEATKQKVCSGSYKAEYININGHIHYKYPEMTNNLVEINKRGLKYGGYLNKDAAHMFEEMKAAAEKDRIILFPQSGYRPNSRQKELFKNKGDSAAALISHASSSAPPGYSEHSTGLALDINGANGKFIQAGSKEYRWLKENAAKYGFEQSFPAGNAQGLDEEPWHYRFVGKDHENDYIFKHAIANDPAMLEKRK